MFIAQSTIQMRSVGAPVRKVINEGFRYDLEQKPAVDQLLGTPTERNMVRGNGYKHHTPPE